MKNFEAYEDKILARIDIKHTFNQSIIKYGEEPQCRQAMEECAELIQAINKCIRYPDRKDCHNNLIEEIADVEIMLYQLKVMFNIDDDQVFAFKVEKAKREQERLKEL
jgi:NTP pyrophosphatase (non-canonical NTP hydrolase)